jgi:predicted Zn-dependent peptidase
MRIKLIVTTALSLALGACSTMPSGNAAPVAANAATSGLQLESQYFTLPNGLKVVLSREASASTVTVGVYYGIGFRIEPRNRTGFAHLFEHLMFQGSQHAPKGAFIGSITNAGGVLNGSTRFDYTNYYQVVPSNALDQVLWLEADRMARPVINKEVLVNQQGVVANEVKVNVINQPYGGWPWLPIPQLANTNWHNAHNFYGELSDLEAATVEDASQFFNSFYRPNNAVLIVAGDIDYADARAKVERYFASVPRGAPVKIPDISEPRQTQEKFRSYRDPLAPRPAFAAAWHVPKRNTPQWYAMGLLDQILAQGQDSRLYQKLVRERGITSSVQAGINLGLGNMYNYNGPMQWTVAFMHDQSKSQEEITAALNEVIEGVRTQPVTQDELRRAQTKIRANLYAIADPATRFGIVDLLGVGALWENDPKWVNQLERGFAKVTPELMMATAREYLRPTNRSILITEAGAAAPAAATAKTGASK